MDKFIKKVLLHGRLGYVKTVGDGIVNAIGLRQVAYGEMVFFPLAGIRGFVCSLKTDSVDILVFGDDRLIKTGDVVMGTGSGLRVPVSKKMLGRTINALGETIDGGMPIENVKFTADINSKAPGIIHREPVSEPVFTGVKVIDSLIPIGRGQRELVIGDKGAGKTSVCFDAMLNQKYENYKNAKDPIYCIYVAIGQKRSSVKTIFENLKKFKAEKHVIVVSATSSDSAALQYLAPYCGCAIGEYFMGFAHALIIYDDLTQHAMAYRQISLLLRRPPGREAYPGDVFYLHSRLLERAAKLHKKYGGGSMTALPVVETLFGDVTAYIPTNVISITDGQIFLDKKLFAEGVIPAINVGLSVSRVGSAAQILSMKKAAGSLKLELAQYREVKDFMKFGSDLDEETLSMIKRGELLTNLLNQKKFSPVEPEEQVLLLFAGLNGYFDRITIKNLENFSEKLLNFVKKSSLFRPHYDLLRFDNYYKEYGNKAVKLMLSYFVNFYSNFHKLTI